MAMSSSADAPAKKEKDPDQRRVTIWNRAQGRKIAGNAAPLSRNLEEYLRKHPHCEKYEGQDRATRYTTHRKILPVGAPPPVRTIPLAYPVGVPMQPGMEFTPAGAMHQRQVQMMLFNQQQAHQAFAAQMHMQQQQQVAQQQIQMQAEAQARAQVQARSVQSRTQAQARAQAEAQVRAQAAAHAQAQEFTRAAREQAEQQERLQNEAKAAAHLELVQSFQAEIVQQQSTKSLHPESNKDVDLDKAAEMPPPPSQQPQQAESPLGMSDEQFRLFMDQQHLSALMQQQRGGEGNATATRPTNLLQFGGTVNEDRAVAGAANALAEATIGEPQAASMNGVAGKSLASQGGRSIGMAGGMSHARRPLRLAHSLSSTRGGRGASQIAMGAHQSSKHLDDNDARVDSALVDKVDKALFSDPPLETTVTNKHASGVLTLPRSSSRTANGRTALPGAISQSFSFMRQSRESLMDFRRRDMSIEAMRIQGRDMSMDFTLSRRLGSRDPSMESNLVRDMSIEFGPNALGPNFGTPFKLARDLSVDMQLIGGGSSAPRGATLQQGSLSEELVGGSLENNGNVSGWSAGQTDANAVTQPGPRIGRTARALGMSSDDLSLVVNSTANHNLYRYAPCGSIEDFYEIRHPF